MQYEDNVLGGGVPFREVEIIEHNIHVCVQYHNTVQYTFYMQYEPFVLPGYSINSTTVYRVTA